MLAHQSTAVATRALLTAQGGSPDDFGTTSPPVNFIAPTFTINCVPVNVNAWSASVQVTQNAHEGDNQAFHLGPGLHSTNLMFWNGSLTNFVAGPGNRRIYVEVSQAIATDSQHAEEEHCRDILRAYDITLRAVQNAVQAAVTGGPYVAASQAGAIQAAKQAIVNGLHPRLQAVFQQASLPNGYNMALLGQGLGRLYLDICDLSQGRDAQGWHYFEPDRTGESWSVWSWTEYAGAKVLPGWAHQGVFGEVKDIRKLVRGPHFSVNTTPSNAIIVL